MLIIDMPMPRDCICCPMAHWNKLDEFTGCEVAEGKLFEVTRNKEYAESNYRPDWCPIKGVLPDEHGDLIDRDAVKKEIMKRMPRGCMSGSADREGIVCTRRMMLYPISHAKVIVAAERRNA